MKKASAQLSVILVTFIVSILATRLAFSGVTQTQAQPQTQITAVPISKIDLLKAKVKQNPDDLNKIVELAQEHYNLGEYDKTTTLLWKYIDKINRAAILLIIRAHEKRNESADMIRAATLLTAKDEKDYEAYYYMGNAAWLKRNKQDALENYKKAIEINPKYQPAYEGIAKFYEKGPLNEKGNLYELRMLYQDMLVAIGPRVEFLTKLCAINVEDVQGDQARSYCQQAIQKNSSIADNHVNLGLIAKQNEESEKANSLLKAAADKFPKSAFAQQEYALLLEEKKNYIDAAKYYDSCTRANDKSEQCWIGLGTSLSHIQKYDQAYGAFKNACKFNRKHSLAIRKALASMRTSKVKDWVNKYEELADQCARL